MSRRPRIPVWWLGQRGPLARFTAYLAIATVLLFGATAMLAVITFNQLTEMRDENRPWVGFEVVQASNPKPGEQLNALVTTKNVGKSPALNVHANFRVAFLKFNSEDGIAECKSCSHYILIPGASAPYPVAISGTMTDYKKDNKKAPAIFGRVDYEDAAGKHYWTTICRYYEIEFLGLSGCLQGDVAGP
jgi:hypothetical protein